MQQSHGGPAIAGFGRFLARRSLGAGGCAKHNLEKSDTILAIAPWILSGAAAASHIERLCG